MKVLHNLTVRSAAAEDAGTLGLVWDAGAPKLGLIGKGENGSLVCTMLDRTATEVTSYPYVFTPLERASIELVLPTLGSDFRDQPEIGDIVLGSQGAFLYAKAFRNDLRLIDIDTGDVLSTRVRGQVITAWRVWHPSIDDRHELIYDSAAKLEGEELL